MRGATRSGPFALGKSLADAERARGRGRGVDQLSSMGVAEPPKPQWSPREVADGVEAEEQASLPAEDGGTGDGLDPSTSPCLDHPAEGDSAATADATGGTLDANATAAGDDDRSRFRARPIPWLSALELQEVSCIGLAAELPRSQRAEEEEMRQLTLVSRRRCTPRTISKRACIARDAAERHTSGGSSLGRKTTR